MRKFTLLLFFVVLWSFSYAQMGEEQYFVDIHGDLRYESRDRFQASLSTNIFGDKVYKDNRGNEVKYSKAMWEKVPGKDRPYFEDFLFSELIHKYRDRRNVKEVYEIDIFGDARYRNNQGQSMTLRRNIMGELEYFSNEFRATLGKDIFENIIYKDNRGNKVTYSKEFLGKIRRGRHRGDGNVEEFLLLGLAKHPFIDDNSPEEARFINNDFFIIRDNREIKVDGLGIVYLYNSIGISFCFDPFWEQTKHRLYVKGKEAGEYDVVSISHPKHCNDADFIENKDLWKPIELVEAGITPEKKKINLRDDHGKDKLYAFAQKLCQSPYVVGIVNSIPYNPHETQFIRAIKDNGLIEIVFTDTDKGLGVVLQSTGRNKRETKKIASILQDKYS